MKGQSAWGSAHAVLTVCVALGGVVVFEAQGAVVVSSPLLPPVGPDVDCGAAVGYAASYHALYGDYGVHLRDPIHAAFTNIQRTPGAGYEQETFNSSLTGDTNWGPIALSGSVTTQVSGGYSSGATGTFPAEIVAMYLTGELGGFFIEIRESPTWPSVGTTTIEDLGGGRYRITSFFDVFTDLRIVGVGGWDAQDDPPGGGHMVLQPTGPWTGACCDPWSGACTQTTQVQCTLPWDYQGDGTVCDPNPCPQPPTGACCDPGTGACTETTEADCTANYLGDGTDCTPNPCPPPPTGACCDPTGACTVTTQSGCAGVYQGDGTTCTPNPCPPPTGACCDPATGACTVTTQLGCTGEYQGDGTVCDPNPCPPPLGACCRPDGSCLDNIEESTCVQGLGGTWKGAGSTCPQFAGFVDCLAGPVEAFPPNDCARWDLNSDGHVDLYDFYLYQQEFTHQHCVPAPVGACCLPDGSCEEINEWDCTNLYGPTAYQGDGTDCDPNPCIGACCDPLTGNCMETTATGCTGNYLGDGTTCTPNPCPPPPTGACCDPGTGACTVTTQSGCSGEYQGDGTTCGPPNPCMGACCFPDPPGGCLETTQTGCFGIYMGDGTDCDPDPCGSPPTGACCDPATGDCTVTTQSGCSGEYQGNGTDCDPNPCGCPSGCACPGTDCWLTSTSCSPDATKVSFAATPIPAGFFCSGQTVPYSGTVRMKAPGPCADTKMQRLEWMCFETNPDTTAIRLLELEMVGCSPISVPGCGDWTVEVVLSPTPVTDGSMTATKEHPSGGTFDAQFWVRPRYKFTSLGPYGVKYLTADPIYMTIQDVPWSFGDNPADTCSTPDDNFQVPVGMPLLECHKNAGGEHAHCVENPGC